MIEHLSESSIYED